MVHDFPYTQAKFSLITSVCILLLAVPVVAQDTGNKVRDKNYVEVTRWVSEVIGYGGRVDQKLGDFETGATGRPLTRRLLFRENWATADDKWVSSGMMGV